MKERNTTRFRVLAAAVAAGMVWMLPARPSGMSQHGAPKVTVPEGEDSEGNAYQGPGECIRRG